MRDAASLLLLPAIALAEACWVVEHGRTKIPAVAALLTDIDADPRIDLVPLDRGILDQCVNLTAIGEMHDRQIVATALCVADQGETVPVVTRDSSITSSGVVAVVW